MRLSPAELNRVSELAKELVGKPWRAAANGPDAFDCWGLVVYVRRALFGNDLPDVARPPVALSLPEARAAFASATKPLGWYQIERPAHGAVAIIGTSGVPSHAGIYLAIPPAAGNVLHCDEAMGVRFESESTLSGRGWSKFRWYTKDSA